MPVPNGVAFPGMGTVVNEGFTVRSDGLQVVTTYVQPKPGTKGVYTTAIYERDTGRPIQRGPSGGFTFEFKPTGDSTTVYARPLYVMVTSDKFEAGRNHERAIGMDMSTGERDMRESAWQRVLRDGGGGVEPEA